MYTIDPPIFKNKRLLERISFRFLTAKYKDKKTIKNEKGEETVVYEYSERQVNKRNKEKSKKVEKLRGIIGDLEKTIYKDFSNGLGKEDNKAAQTALAVALINHTYERVGNDESAANGHYGVTGWKKKHLSFSGGKAVLKYTGKSGVKHEKTIDEKKLVKALKDISKGKSAEDPLLDDVSASDVNDYLDSFNITAKDLRGYHANREMQERLKALRKENGELPTNRKEKKALLKEEFDEALKGAAEAVGHEEATLRGQYLVPHLEDSFMKDGTVITCLKKATFNRIAAMVFATKSQSEKEDEEAERLVRKEPKLKPPRKDRRRSRVKIEKQDDPDLDTKDMSMNYKIVGSVSDLYQMSQRISALYLKFSSDDDEDDDEDEEGDEGQKDEFQKAWEQMVNTQTFKNPKTNEDVKFNTLEKADPEKAKKVREEFKKYFEKEKAKAEKKQKDKEKEDKKKGKEKALAEQGKESERVDIGGKEVVVDKNRPDSVRDLEKALDNIDDQWRDESDEDYQKRVGEAIKSHVSKLNNKQKLEIMRADIFDANDENHKEALDVLNTLDKSLISISTPRLLGGVGGIGVSGKIPDMIKKGISTVADKLGLSKLFGANKEESEKRAVEAQDALLRALMGDTITKAVGDKKTGKMSDKQKAKMGKNFVATTKKIFEDFFKGSDDVESSISNSIIENANRNLVEDNDALRNSPKAADNPDAVDKLNEAEKALLAARAERQKLLDAAKQDTEGTEKEKYEKRIKELEGTLKTMESQIKDIASILTVLSRSEMIKQYQEMIQNSKNMTPEEKKKAIKRSKSKNFDPEAALAAASSEDEDASAAPTTG